MDKNSRKKKLIIVNLITCSRIIGALLLIPIYLTWGGLVSAIFCIIFFLTDMIDGRMARKYNIQTFLGALLDGTCDKVLAITAFSLLATKTIYILIPILLEILIAWIMIMNIRRGKNAQTNLLGKIKLNIIAINIVISFLIVGVPYIYNNYNEIYIIHLILLPTVIIQMATAVIYAITKDNRDDETKNKDKKLQEIKPLDQIKKDLLDTEFYLKNKDSGIKKLFLKEMEW